MKILQSSHTKTTRLGLLIVILGFGSVGFGNGAEEGSIIAGAGALAVTIRDAIHKIQVELTKIREALEVTRG